MAAGAYALPDLVEDLDRVVAGGKDPRMLIGQASEALRKLLGNPGSVPPAFLQARHGGGSTRNLVHRHPGGRYVILAIVWSPGCATPIHDHGVWGVSGVRENALRVTQYVRLDDGSRPDHADLDAHSSLLVGPGGVTYVLPPDEEIHRIENPSSERAVSIHVYGRDIRTCHVFDPATGRVGSLDLAYHNIV